MIDGNAGAVCDYKIAAHEGIEIPVSISALSPTSTICLGSSIDLFAMGGATGSYTWSPPAGLNSTMDDTVTATPTTAGTYTFTVTSISASVLCPATMNDFTLTVDPCTLPVELISFDATCQSDNVILNWVTATEINNDYFTIERSVDANVFESIGTVNGNGNSTALLNYYWTDENPIDGKAYYRLKQTDFDGDFQYHDIQRVNCMQSNDISIYPNLFESSFMIQFSGKTTYPIRIEVMDYLGRIVHTENVESKVVEIALNKHAAGTYFVKVVTESSQVVERIVKYGTF